MRSQPLARSSHRDAVAVSRPQDAQDAHAGHDRPALHTRAPLYTLSSVLCSAAVAMLLSACSAALPAPETTQNTPAAPLAAVPSSSPAHTAFDAARLQSLLPADVLLLGERHDAPDHQRLQRDVVAWLAARGQLAAVVMEMAERGHSTSGLPRNASEAQVQAALQWNNAAWPWATYREVVMAAVAAGVPVWGGNLPRADMRAAMSDAHWDQHLPTAALQQQYTALREGHCGLLPESQIAPMARIQIARDASMAQAVQSALQPGKTVLLVAGGGHVLRTVGVPTHWPFGLTSKVVLAQTEKALAAIKNEADWVIETPALPASDACAPLRAKQRP